MRNGKQEPETFDIDSLPIGIEELAREEGEKIGLEKGEKKEKERIALMMLKDNLSLSQIAQYTNLTEKEINDLNCSPSSEQFK